MIEQALPTPCSATNPRVEPLVDWLGLETQFRSEKQGELIRPASVERLVAQFDAGEFDVVAIGRALLADPGWVNRLRDGNLDGFSGYDPATALAALA